MNFMDRSWVIVMVVTLMLSACGGSGGSSSNGGPRTGNFGIVPVEGLSYRTASQSGTTGANGEYLYQPGEDVTFAIGDLEIGTAAAQANMNIFDLYGISAPGNQDELYFLYGTQPARGPIYQAVNAIITLNTLDRDYDSSNGIQLDPTVSTEFAALEIDLAVPSGLSDNRLFREFLYRSAGAGILSPRPVKSGGLSLQHYFDFNVYVAGRYSADNNGDGQVDYSYSRGFDAQGKFNTEQQDYNGDGVVDGRYEEARDANQQRTMTRRDADNDGIWENTRNIHHNEFGNEIRVETVDGTGLVTYSRTQEWDEQGALVRRETIDASSHTLETWLYREGVRDLYHRDLDADGTIDMESVFTFDERGNWITRLDDRGADGTINARYERSLNDFDQIVWDATDSNNDGVWNFESRNQYDSRGNRISSQRYNNGVLTFEQTIEFSNGLRVALIQDNDGDGTQDNAIYWVHNDAGLVIESRYDTDYDGVIDSVSLDTHDDAGHLIRTDNDSDADGSIDDVYHYVYDGPRLMGTETDVGNDGSIDATSSHEDYQAFPITAWY